MNKGKLIFAQVLEHLPLSTFRRCVSRYCGEHKVKSFSCLVQFLWMAFAQLICRESLRDIEVCLRAQSSKLYHVGIRGQEPRLVFPSMRLVAECCDRKNRGDAFIPCRAQPSLTRRCQMGDNCESKEPRSSERGILADPCDVCSLKRPQIAIIVTPTLRMDYRFSDSWTFEASGGVEKTLTDSETQKDSTLRQFFFFGLRWDFS